MNMEEFVALTAPDRYDFSDDGANEEYNKLDSFEDAYAKFFVYMYERAMSIKNYEEGHAGVMEYGISFGRNVKKSMERLMIRIVRVICFRKFIKSFGMMRLI